MAGMPTQFDLTREPLDAYTHLISVRGEIHVSTAPRFAMALTDAIGDGANAIVLDLAEVEFIDSTGLGVLLTGLRQVARAGGRMALVCANPTVLRLFEITRLDSTFDIFPARPEALAHVQAAPADGSSAGAP